MHPVLALFRRNAWATARLLNWCLWQPADLLQEGGGDVYGSIAGMFNHLAGAETRYLHLLTGELPADAVNERHQMLPPADLRAPFGRLQERWAAVLRSDRDLDAPKAHLRGERRVSMPDWLPLAQAIHHGDDHRAQIATLLGRAGVTSPSADGWYFGWETDSGGEPPAWAGSLLARCFGHHLWATQAALEHCEALSEGQLQLSAPGTYGTLAETLRHLVSADFRYLARLQGTAEPGHVEQDRPAQLLQLWARQRRGWLEYLDSRPGFEQPVRCGDGRYPGWVLVLQAIHHGNDHRAHLGTVLLSHQLELPALDVWAYAAAEGAYSEA